MIKDTTAANEAVTPNSREKSFFDELALDGYKVYFRNQLRNKEQHSPPRQRNRSKRSD